MRVIGTAGHVDHGKSSLVQAITGINPDRLAEEQRRQMTIDLGFAWLTLPDGESVGIVDVPGHRDFIENMLAGAGGIDAVLFVHVPSANGGAATDSDAKVITKTRNKKTKRWPLVLDMLNSPH
jgi:selenocysteine-specific translation elongation factor